MIKYLRKYWFFAILAPIFMMGEVSMDLLQPRMMSTIIDEGVLGLSNNNVGDVHLVIITGLKMIGLVTIGCFCGVMSGVFANLCSQNFGNDVRKDAFRNIMSFSFEQTDKFTTGSLITRVTNDITQIQNLVSQCIRGFVRTFLLFAGGIGCMLMLDLSFGIVVACALPLVVIFAVNHIISIGTISAFIVYAKQFGRPIDELAQIYGQIQTAIAGAERVFAIMDEPCEDKSGSRNMDNAKGVITFKNVNFSYVEGKPVLKDFNFEVRAGHKVALVGQTGSGKTTVVNLLMRFYDVDSGEIMIDGVNIKDIDCNELRKNTAIVLQDTVLFADTVKNNLKYSKEDASEEELENAARMSNCHSMIRHLQNGYDTELAQSGYNLSQGQRQLLSIARAFLASPKILILDEATSSVDTRTEKHIQDAMHRLMENRTSLIIAHRLSTIQDADCIVVMDNGRIVETGNHEELIKQRGRYYELYMTQFAGSAT